MKKSGSYFVCALSFLAALCLWACPKSSEPNVLARLVNTSVQRPSNVAVYFAVEMRDGTPVVGLQAKDFKIYEDGNLISPFESKQTILNPEVSVGHHILLLLDLSGSIVGSGSLPSLINAAKAFTDKMKHPMAIYGFDGGPKLIPVSGFTTQAEEIKATLDKLLTYKVKDPSTNLNGAVVSAVSILEKELGRSTQPLRFATLVVFSDGTDRAHRVTEEQMFKTLESSTVNVFVIGLGGEISEKSLARLGKDGLIRVADKATITNAFNQAAAKIESSGRKFYLLSYCSPSRAGKHELRIDVHYQGEIGSLVKHFDATGFGPNCDPNQKPSFSLRRVTFKANQ